MSVEATSSGRTDLWVRDEVLSGLAEIAQAHHPNEACGILLGNGNRIDRAIEAQNTHPTPKTHFEIDPQALIDAHRAEREGGPQVIGYFHSHPTGDPSPSATDRAMAAGDGKVWAIIADGTAAMWRDQPEGFLKLSYAVTEG